MSINIGNVLAKVAPAIRNVIDAPDFDNIGFQISFPGEHNPQAYDLSSTLTPDKYIEAARILSPVYQMLHAEQSTIQQLLEHPEELDVQSLKDDDMEILMNLLLVLATKLSDGVVEKMDANAQEVHSITSKYADEVVQYSDTLAGKTPNIFRLMEIITL